jgi:AraC-like DNA-binding protein
MALGCQALLIAQLLTSNIVKRHAIPTAAFIACVMCYLLADWEPMQKYAVFYVLLGPAFCLTFIFWLFSRALFDDSFRLQFWMLWVLLAIVALRYFLYNITRGDFVEMSETSISMSSILEYSLSLIFVVLGIVAATRNKKDDLISVRYEFRNIFVFLTAILIFFTILSEIAFQHQKPDWLEFSQKLIIAALTFFFGMKSLALAKGFFLEVKSSAETSIDIQPDTQLLDSLAEIMNVQEYWLTEGLTIRQLADKMRLKEYRLRQAINQHLGFRNFNDFLNSFRITEAKRILQDSTKKEQTILEIAYQLGYSSLSPFNKAFKQSTGMTPSEWRKLAEK